MRSNIEGVLCLSSCDEQLTFLNLIWNALAVWCACSTACFLITHLRVKHAFVNPLSALQPSNFHKHLSHSEYLQPFWKSRPAFSTVGVARRTLSFVGILKPTESAEGSGFLWMCTQELLLLKAQANSSVLWIVWNMALLGCWTTSVLTPCFLTDLTPATTDTPWWVFVNYNPAITFKNKDVPGTQKWMILLTL